MLKIPLLLLCLALNAAAPAFAAPAAGPVRDSGFGRMWTGWVSANREALVREQEEAERLQHDLATADARRLRALRDQGRPLGERVGAIVREGDCEEGERVAREAGDFALVEAVRRHCGAIPAAAETPEL
jgi:hypothetical protein